MKSARIVRWSLLPSRDVPTSSQSTCPAICRQNHLQGLARKRESAWNLSASEGLIRQYHHVRMANNGCLLNTTVSTNDSIAPKHKILSACIHHLRNQQFKQQSQQLQTASVRPQPSTASISLSETSSIISEIGDTTTPSVTPSPASTPKQKKFLCASKAAGLDGQCGKRYYSKKKKDMVSVKECCKYGDMRVKEALKELSCAMKCTIKEMTGKNKKKRKKNKKMSKALCRRQKKKGKKGNKDECASTC